MILLDAINAFSEILLAVAALYVAGNGLRGWRKEVAAARTSDESRAAILREDAKTYYVMAGLQQPWVLLFVVAGSMLKLAITIAGLL